MRRFCPEIHIWDNFQTSLFKETNIYQYPNKEVNKEVEHQSNKQINK